MDGETPKIADMGLGRMLRPEELASTKGVGTILYMAPEILFGKIGATYMYNADIWSFGVIFYEMLCYQLPFGMTYQSPLGVLTNLITDESVPLVFSEELDIPPKLQNIVAKTLERNPVRRYKTAQEILQDLKEFSKVGDEAVEREIGLISQILHDPSKASQAETKLKSILKKFPDSPRVYLHFGEFYNRCGNYKKAIELFTNGVEKDPDNSLLHWDLAIAYQKTGSLNPAVKNLKKALDLGLEKSLQRYAKTLLNSIEKKL
jgi:serine/threonine protein kinase